jgi:hypothetical protein
VPFDCSQPEWLLPISLGFASAAQRTKARHRESRGAHTNGVASKIRLTEDHGLHLRQIFLSVTSQQTDQTRSGCATSLTFRQMKVFSISQA